MAQLVAVDGHADGSVREHARACVRTALARREVGQAWVRPCPLVGRTAVVHAVHHAWCAALWCCTAEPLVYV